MPRPDLLDTALALALLERAMQTYENSELACAALFETLVAHRVPVDRGCCNGRPRTARASTV